MTKGRHLEHTTDVRAFETLVSWSSLVVCSSLYRCEKDIALKSVRNPPGDLQLVLPIDTAQGIGTNSTGVLESVHCAVVSQRPIF